MLIGVYLLAGLGEELDASSVEVMVPSHPFSKAVLNCRQAQTAEITEAAASELECTRLRLRADERVYRIHRHRNRGGRVFLIEDVTLPATLFPGLADRGVIADHIGVLAQEYGILLVKVEERISLGTPPDAIANALLVAPGTSVIVLDRVVHMLDGFRPVEWRLAHCHPAGAYDL